MNKREIKKQFKILLNITNGVTSSMKYEQLKKAKNFAIENGLEFPKEAQETLTLAAKQTVLDAINFNHK